MQLNVRQPLPTSARGHYARMKKVFMFLMALTISCGAAFASDKPEVIMYEANGEVYFITEDLIRQLEQDADNTCLEGVIQEDNKSGTKIEVFYELLLSQCRQQIATLYGETKQGDDFGDKIIGGLANVMNRLSQKNLIPLGPESEWKGCVITRQNLEKRLKEAQQDTKYLYTITADIDSCINAINVHTDDSSCPLVPSVSDKGIIANMADMNAKYKDKTLSFPERPDIKDGQILIFNGQVLVVCDGGMPVHIVKPAFSGYVACKGAEFQAYPNVGSTPNGIYLAKHDSVQEPKNLDLWGGYRIPLIPSHQTETYGRANMYLHGTADKDKRRSGGCISLGVWIDEFINSDWFKDKAKDLLIIVDS
ncbi:MAG: DUF2778 domain-containing protein [Alphaproteobacteria bacterium]|nr:DUF2778 domain-containing protein [Alphaproteobacteria bacterium]